MNLLEWIMVTMRIDQFELNLDGHSQLSMDISNKAINDQILI